MTFRPRYRWLLALVAGGVSATGFAPLDLWPLTLIAFAALLWLVAGAPRLWSAIRTGWWFGLGHFTVGLNWIATAFVYQDAMPHWLGWIAVVLLSLYLAVYPAMAAGLAWRWGLNRAPAKPGVQYRNDGTGLLASQEHNPLRFTLVFAAAWIVTEWLRATMFTGFAWNPLGVIWVGTPVAGLARWIGTFGLSGLAVLVAGIRQPRSRTGWLGAALAVALAAIILTANLLLKPAPSSRSFAIHIVQPNIGQQDKWREGFEEQNFARLARLTGKPTTEPRIILWPEAAVPEYLEEEDWARERIAGLMGPKDVLLTGGTSLVWDDQRRLIAARNSLFGLDATGRILGRYDKAHLVPYGEYLPMRPILSAIGLSRLAPGDLDFWPGPGPATFALPGFGKVGVQICYEIIFPAHVIDRNNRPDFLFNPSNDAWFGQWGPPQHLAQARLRAIEEGMPIVRSTPTGISAVIDGNGRLLASLPWRTAGAIDARLPLAGSPTLFARCGNILSFLFAALLVVLAIASRRKPG
jgi:apolipoprotein N-acyltransferase